MQSGSYDQVIQFQFIDSELSMKLEDGKKVYLKDIDQYVGYKDEGMGAYGLLFKNNNLHFEIQIDRSHPIGQEDKAGIKDILMESAVTSIQDCEDSVAAVDAEDKIIVYRNWLGLMKGNLKRSFDKNGKFKELWMHSLLYVLPFMTLLVMAFTKTLKQKVFIL